MTLSMGGNQNCRPMLTILVASEYDFRSSWCPSIRGLLPLRALFCPTAIIRPLVNHLDVELLTTIATKYLFAIPHE